MGFNTFYWYQIFTLDSAVFKDGFLFQHVREPTRFREEQMPSILDLILTNEENSVEKIDYLPSLGKIIMQCSVLTLIDQ